MIYGIDISHNNTINWNNLSPKVQFVYMKATQGASFKDPMFQSYWQECKSRNLIHGAYHFLTAVDSAQMQTDNFLSRGIDWSLPNVLPPVIDIEDQVPASLNSGITQNKQAFIDLISQWIEIVTTKTGRTPIIYSYKNFFAEYLNNHSWPNPIWLASYQTTPPGLPVGWDKWTLWQYSQHGKLDLSVSGGEFDLDCYDGTVEGLLGL